MPLFEWSDKYSVNIKEIDAQHQDLIDTINLLHETMLQKRSKSVMGEVIGRLQDYAVVHFRTEEELMKKYEYPGYRDHKKKHDEMRQYIFELMENHKNNNIIVSVNVMKYLRKWLSEHILGTDMMYQDFLNSEGIY